MDGCTVWTSPDGTGRSRSPRAMCLRIMPGRAKVLGLVRVLAQLYRQDKVKDVAEIRMDYAEDKILVANIGT